MNASFSKEPHKGREYFSAGFYFALLCVLCVSVVNPVFSKEATPLAEDEVAEKRMVAISSELRCLVCQNESLSGSHAELANDLRREIRTLIKDGNSTARCARMETRKARLRLGRIRAHLSPLQYQPDGSCAGLANLAAPQGGIRDRLICRACAPLRQSCSSTSSPSRRR